MKKILVLILTIGMLFSMNSFADFGIMPIGIIISDETELIINEEKMIFSDYAIEPYDKGDVKMLPLRAISESLGFDVTWNGSDKSINVDRETEHFKVFIGKDAYILNEVVTALDTAPEIVESRTFVPHTFFEKLMTVTVMIDGNKIVVEGYIDYEFDLEEDQDFEDIVADVPANYLEDNFYEYKYGITTSPVENMGKAIRIDGSNHSDDMFMGFYKKINGLEANKTYIYKLSFDIGTNVSGGMMGIGGSPGSSVYVKAGILSSAPISELNEQNYYELTNLDKANQSQSGTDLKVVSNMKKVSGDYSEAFEYKTVVNHFIATTNELGEAFILVGTDSGFEGLTTVYYDNIKLSVKEATEYNQSILQETHYELKYTPITLENKTVITVPKATNFVNVEKENKLNLLIDEKVNEIVNKEEVTSLRFSYAKKSNGLLSIVFNGIYKIEGGTFAFYDVLNVNTNNMTEIKTEDLLKQDETSLTTLNNLFSAKLEQKGLLYTTINNSMNVFYEQGIYAVVYLAKDSDTRETMIIFDENEVKDLMNY
jgi:hypothetical protein